MISYLLFDLDNTLYPRSSGLGREMDRRMTRYVAEWLGVPMAEAEIQRRTNLKRFGTTLRWLVTEHDLTDVDHFLDAVHPTDLDQFLTEKDREQAQETLHEIDVPAAILTNSPMEHARRGHE